MVAMIASTRRLEQLDDHQKLKLSLAIDDVMGYSRTRLAGAIDGSRRQIVSCSRPKVGAKVQA